MDLKIRKNYIFNLLYQFSLLIIPLITIPYVSRVLGTAAIGEYSFLNSIISYFVIFASLGFPQYAQREIANHQNNIYDKTKIFWEINIAKLLSTLLSMFVFLLILFLFKGNQVNYLLILSIHIIAVCFDITFFYQGNEEFKSIVLRNLFIKVVGLIAVFVFVRKSNDLGIYMLIQSLVIIFSNIFMWLGLRKNLCKIHLKDLQIFKHFIPTFRLFIPTIAISIYTILDKTLIGVLIPGTKTIVDSLGNEIIVKISDLENGFYEQAEKIVKMSMLIVTSLGTVMAPRNSKELSDGSYDKFITNIKQSLDFTFMVGFAIMFGLIGISNIFVPWFFGYGYDKVSALINIFSILIIVIGMSNIMGLQYLIPLKEDKKYTKSVTIGAVINIILNIVLIPMFYSYGACAATIIGEICVTICMYIYARKDIDLKYVFQVSYKKFVAGIFMCLVLIVISRYMTIVWYNIFLLIMIGAVIYFLVLFLLKDKSVKNYINIIKKKI